MKPFERVGTRADALDVFSALTSTLLKTQTWACFSSGEARRAFVGQDNFGSRPSCANTVNKSAFSI